MENSLNEILRDIHGQVVDALEDMFDEAEIVLSALVRKDGVEQSTAIGPAEDLEKQKKLLATLLAGLRHAHGWSDEEISGFIASALYEADAFDDGNWSQGKLLS